MLIPTLINCFCASEALGNEVMRCDIIKSTSNVHSMRGNTVDGDVKYKLTLLRIGTGHTKEWEELQLHDVAASLLLLILGIVEEEE